MKNYRFYQHRLGFVLICACILGLIVLDIQGCRSGSAQDPIKTQSTLAFQTEDDLQRELENLYANVKQDRLIAGIWEAKAQYAQVQLEILREIRLLRFGELVVSERVPTR